MDGAVIALLILIAVFYFLPAVIGAWRDVKNLGMIFLINFVFGWTVLGWLAALIWAVVEQPKVKTITTAWSEPFYK